MARKKDSKALFEVLSRTDSSMSVPDWMKPSPVEDPAAEEGETTPVEQDQTPSPAEEPTPDAEAELPSVELEKQTPEPPDEDVDAKVENEPETDETTEYEKSEPAAGETPEKKSTPAKEEAEVLDGTPPGESKPRPKRFFAGGASEKSDTPFSMNPKNIAIFIAIFGVLILLAFVLGWITTRNRGTTPPSPATEQPPPTQTAKQRAVVDTDAPVKCVSGRRDPDRYFLMIARLRGNGDADREEADKIIAFCKEHGLPADMVELQHGNRIRVAVWSLLGFRYKTSRPALEHVRKVEDVGEQYFRTYQTYTFRQPRDPDGSLQPVFYPGKMEQPAEK